MPGLNEIKMVFDKLLIKNDNENGEMVPNLDFSKGILQSIGYKEFYKFYEKFGKSDENLTIFDEPKSIYDEG